jgi:hypothetical protein
MRDFVDIGPGPCNEDCAQTGRTDETGALNRLECRAYIAALIKKYGAPPEGSGFSIKGNSHDFGKYYEVRFTYDTVEYEAREYAVHVEQGLATWAEARFQPPVVYNDRGMAILTRTVEECDLGPLPKPCWQIGPHFPPRCATYPYSTAPKQLIEGVADQLGKTILVAGEGCVEIATRLVAFLNAESAAA